MLTQDIQENELDLRIRRVLAGATPMLAEKELEVLRVIWGHKGARNAIRSAAIAHELRLSRGESSRRWIAATVESLINLHRIPIGGLRVPPYGYFLISSKEDLDQAIHSIWGEVYAHLRRLRALTGKNDVARLFGQSMLALYDCEHEERRMA